MTFPELSVARGATKVATAPLALAAVSIKSATGSMIGRTLSAGGGGGDGATAETAAIDS